MKFNRFVANRHILAVAREKRVDVFECLSDMPFKLLKSFEDVNDYFYALDWSYNQLDASPILAAGGELGVIRVINATRGVEIGYFRIRKISFSIHNACNLKLCPLQLESSTT